MLTLGERLQLCNEVRVMNESHRRALGSSLLIIEKDLHMITEKLEQDNKDFGSILQSTTYDVDPQTKKKILNIATSMLDEIRQLKEKFKLERDEKSLSHWVYSTLIEIWIILEDLRPEKLKAYGQMSDIDKKLLEPNILKLLKMLDEIYRI
jgi:hypothetical protein